MCTRAYLKTAELEPAGKHGILNASAESHDDKTSHDTAHDTTPHDTTAHDTATVTATTTTVRRNDDANSTINGQPESTVQQDKWRAHGTLLLTGRGG